MVSFGSTVFFGAGLLGLLTLGVYRSRRDPAAVLSLFGLVLLLIPARLVFPGVGGIGTPANLIALTCLAWWIAAFIVPSLGRATGPQPVRPALLFFVVTTLLSYAFAFHRPLTDLEVSGADRSLIALAALLGVALIAADGLQSRERLDALLRRLLILGSVVALIGVGQFLLRVEITPSIKPPGLVENSEIFTAKSRSLFQRPYSTTLHPIEFSVVMAALLPLAVHYALISRTQFQTLRNWMVVGLLAGATAMGVSRSGILGLAVGIGTLSLGWDWRRRLNAAVVALLFMGAMKVAVPGLIGTLRNLILNASDDPSIQGRLEDIALVKAYLSETPVLGRGTGTFNGEEYFVLDNEYYKTLMENGLLGLLALLLLLLTACIAARRAASRYEQAEDKHLGQALLASILTFGVTMATFDGLSYPMFSGVLFLLIGSAGAYWRLAPKSAEVGAGVDQPQQAGGVLAQVGTPPDDYRRVTTSRTLRQR